MRGRDRPGSGELAAGSRRLGRRSRSRGGAPPFLLLPLSPSNRLVLLPTTNSPGVRRAVRQRCGISAADRVSVPGFGSGTVPPFAFPPPCRLVSLSVHACSLWCRVASLASVVDEHRRAAGESNAGSEMDVVRGRGGQEGRDGIGDVT
jgi:hypothetical protein